ncbi:sigma-54-dependent transcriptional regulator [Sphingomonas sp. ERG5]|uniref:sigma-54-dependent transcriptional regulator n=1 Tax=Sphingomonas sp. ERG5 TaxID=1381597 RepID=UPI00054C36F0|nr:sigma-54 dependent transcriptional regulator [Sphingomonas sp. ERG5]
MFDTSTSVIFVEDDDQLRLATVQALDLAGFDVRPFANAPDALAAITKEFAGVVVSDIRMPRMDGLQLLDHVRALDADIPVILVTGHGDVTMAVSALHNGAFDFLIKPFAADHLTASVTRALERRQLVIDNRRLRAAAAESDSDGPLIGESAPMVSLRATIRQLAQADVDVLVEGETGTGKELVALMLHRLGPRRGRPFVAVDCAALPEALAETELFGHAADSVAHTRLPRAGRIAASNGGTLLLDEIDSMSPAIQAKLLRVLEEREVLPVGADRPQPVDLRVVATSKRNLAEAVADGAFRADLFYRLNVLRLRVPPLRERAGDVLALFATFVEEFRQRLDAADVVLDDALRRKLQSHDWPGNVRELRNFALETVLGLKAPDDAVPLQPGADLPTRVTQFEAKAIEDALRASGGSVARALTLLGIPRKTFYDKITRHGIDLAAFRGT